MMRLLVMGMTLTVVFHSAVADTLTSNPGPVKTEIAEIDGQYVFLRDGQPYTVRGAGIETLDYAEFAARGGNSFRNWTTDNAMEILDKAHEFGLTVSLCLGMGREREGFDYSDTEAVARQFENVREEVLKYKDHPALMNWIIGNELNLFYTNPRVYDAVNDISKMIHELDPNHPTTSALAGFDEDLVSEVNKRADDLDFVSFQLYGDLVNLPKNLSKTKFARPYMVTEWGARGHWEVPTAFWGAPIEMNSSKKAENYQEMYDKVIASKSPYNLGSYVFLWGQKQERTSTWYGLFVDTGESTEVVDVMERVWTGQWPENRAPQMRSFRLNNRSASDDPVLKPDREYKARVSVRDPDKDPVTYRWEIRLESTATESGGDAEAIPPLITGLIVDEDDNEITLKAPPVTGAYRLFVFAYDGKGHAAHANIPFGVNP